MLYKSNMEQSVCVYSCLLGLMIVDGWPKMGGAATQVMEEFQILRSKLRLLPPNAERIVARMGRNQMLTEVNQLEHL